MCYRHIGKTQRREEMRGVLLQVRKPKIEQVGECGSWRWLLGPRASWGSGRVHVWGRGLALLLSHPSKGRVEEWAGKEV